ncbi:ABC transporter substrate-binding protein [Pseudovibrio sp. JE062]|uniref:ABC transporter substrate-binding protein n=1 Tax=Pseudovibrio sp. JE062 TaxID=439495 RepID=UPI000186C788|nr:ABC transporter substrate-binding protein [Pseudovibrio sp. JE062]EEA94916.1 extracellular solute-binding protein, family 5 [Pseudovibrio sp. JE062]
MHLIHQPLVRVAAATLAALLLTLAAAIAGPVGQLVITDARGDRGMLAPYIHGKNGIGYLYTTYVFDSLLSQKKDGDVSPALAKRWTISRNGLICDIYIDLRAHWHDGEPVTAEDAAFTFSYMQEHPYVFADVRNVKEAKVLSHDHLRLQLKKPDAGLLTGMLLSMPVLPKHVYADIAEPQRFAEPEAVIGSGPYKLADYNKAQGRYVLEANADYYLGTPKFKRIAIVKMATDAALRAAKADEIDIISYLPPERLEQAKENGLNVVKAFSNHSVRLGFNHAGRFGNKDLRHAIAYAINRPALISTAYQDTADVADTGFFQEASPWHSDDVHPPYAFSPHKAADLLRAQGWARAEDQLWYMDGEQVVLRVLASKRETKAAKVLAEQLETFGIKLDVRIMERAALQDSLSEGNYDLALYASSTLGDPNGILRRVFGKKWASDRYSGKKLRALADAQSVATSRQQRQDILNEFQEVYSQELPAYAIANPYMVTAYNDKLSSLEFMPGGVAIGVPSALHKSYLVD